MEFRQSGTWQRHQLAAIERMQIDIGRLTRPVMSLTGTFSLVYLLTWCPLYLGLSAEELPLIYLVLAGISGMVVAMIFPSFALAVAIEGYFYRRLGSSRRRSFKWAK